MSECGHCRDCWGWQKIPDGWGYCGKTFSSKGKSDDPTSLAYATDTDEYHALLVTRPDFGCVQYTVREPV